MSKTILERKIQSCNQVNIRLEDDKEDPDIIGCVFMSNGYLVACDLSNNSIKLLDSSFAIKDSLKFPNYPWGVSIIDDNTVIVSIPEKFLLQYVTVFPKLELGTVIKLERRCLAVEVSGEHIYVSLSSKMSGDGEVRILNRESGQEKRRLGIRASGPPSFFHPNYIAASTGGDKIFVSNFGSQKLISLKSNGNIIYQHTNEDMGSPTGVCCDDDDNVLLLLRQRVRSIF